MIAGVGNAVPDYRNDPGGDGAVQLGTACLHQHRAKKADRKSKKS
jgi:hypothetical protein